VPQRSPEDQAAFELFLKGHGMQSRPDGQAAPAPRGQ
jgi:hypothetical protein